MNTKKISVGTLALGLGFASLAQAADLDDRTAARDVDVTLSCDDGGDGGSCNGECNGECGNGGDS